MARPDPARIPNLRHLFATAAVAQRGSIGQAAHAIHLSQPAVTQAIAKLEATLGNPLFERASNGMAPTPAGRQFAARISRALDWLKTGERAFSPPPALHRLATTVQLRALIAVVENRGFSTSARALGLAQQSIHRAIRDLEALCGQPLFLRTPHGLDPTHEARALARAAGLAFAEIRQGMDEVRESLGFMDGRLNIGCLPLARTHLLPTAATRLLAQFPDVRLRIIDGPYGELLHGLRHGELDLIIGALRAPAPAADIHQDAYFSEHLRIAVRAGHPILSAPTPSLENLAALEWIVPREGTPARAHFTNFFTAGGLAAPSRVIECSSLVAARGLLLQSNRAAILSLSQIRYELLSGQLAVLPQPIPGSSRPIGLTFRDNWKPTRVQAAFIDCIAKIVDEDLEAGGNGTNRLEERPAQPG
ncbi:transcriptional regulator [Acidocella aquatica]|uniref:Transcriptional regulator n=1 Tax=Acidocella aquatica TaxID=1922313 RepID=A0ABQ6A141_9PROT|nr:LysR family transcriptional regulator [Acidocella aquatica]GLR66160.1 transcriptional regulator [Acidocella aquatica]